MCGMIALVWRLAHPTTQWSQGTCATPLHVVQMPKEHPCCHGRTQCPALFAAAAHEIHWGQQSGEWNAGSLRGPWSGCGMLVAPKAMAPECKVILSASATCSCGTVQSRAKRVGCSFLYDRRVCARGRITVPRPSSTYRQARSGRPHAQSHVLETSVLIFSNFSA